MLWLWCPDLLSAPPKIRILYAWICSLKHWNIFTLFNCLSISSLLISMFEGNGNTGTRVVSEILYRCHDGLAHLAGLRCRATSTSIVCSHFSCPYFLPVFQLAKASVFHHIGRIKAPDPWNDQNIKDVIWGTYTQIPRWRWRRIPILWYGCQLDVRLFFG